MRHHRDPRVPYTLRATTRRDFLGLAGMSAITGGLMCVGGAVGYLLLERWGGAESGPASVPTLVPSPAATRSGQIKQIARPLITPRAGWLAAAVDHTAENEAGDYSLDNAEGWREYDADLRAMYQTVVVHHSVIYETDDVTTMREIQRLHMETRKWADIGYHFGVGKSGQVFEGRDLAARGTHVEGYNTGSVGVVFFGNFEVESPTVEQIESGRGLIDWLALRLELTHLAGHGDFNDFTKCPGAHMVVYLDTLAQSAGLRLGTDGYVPSEEQLITPPPE
ncbi:MAG: N-acetylmuramoyl-L-alanine amidase [Anaerolineae bacterium]|nr:N-acetylmuramoyl-L-alanine amidase [Anaerolineae bacterium]